MVWLGCWALVICALVPAPHALAYPPAPHHIIYGLVRDQYGTPLLDGRTKVVLQTPAGVQFTALLSPGAGPGINYQFKVPMDAGLTPDLYQPNALETAAPFRIFVVINQTTNLPIQMAGDFSHLGKPGQRTQLDLTLGVDANGDGLPDAWELAFLASLGSNLSLAQLNANSILTPDGLTLREQFLLGNALFDPVDSFTVKLVGMTGEAPTLEFTTMTGRSYTVLGSADLNQWMPLSFSVPAEGANGSAHTYYFSPDIHTMQLQVMQPSDGPRMRFFRLMLQ